VRRHTLSSISPAGNVPRHSVYYIVPAQPEQLHELTDYLNSATAQRLAAR